MKQWQNVTWKLESHAHPWGHHDLRRKWCYTKSGVAAARAEMSEGGDHCWEPPPRGECPVFSPVPTHSLPPVPPTDWVSQNQSESVLGAPDSQKSALWEVQSRGEEGKGLGNVYEIFIWIDMKLGDNMFWWTNMFTKTLNEMYFFVSFITKWVNFVLLWEQNHRVENMRVVFNSLVLMQHKNTAAVLECTFLWWFSREMCTWRITGVQTVSLKMPVTLTDLELKIWLHRKLQKQLSELNNYFCSTYNTLSVQSTESL